jgi:hypothetical protein
VNRLGVISLVIFFEIRYTTTTKDEEIIAGKIFRKNGINENKANSIWKNWG